MCFSILFQRERQCRICWNTIETVPFRQNWCKRPDGLEDYFYEVTAVAECPQGFPEWAKVNPSIDGYIDGPSPHHDIDEQRCVDGCQRVFAAWMAIVPNGHQDLVLAHKQAAVYSWPDDATCPQRRIGPWRPIDPVELLDYLTKRYIKHHLGEEVPDMRSKMVRGTMKSHISRGRHLYKSVEALVTMSCSEQVVDPAVSHMEDTVRKEMEEQVEVYKAQVKERIPELF
jgi:hypothetical protein